MSGPRIPHSYKVFRDAVFYREFPSLKMLSEYMVENHFPHLKVDSMRKYIPKFPRGGSKNYNGFTFEADPTWVGSKATKAVNDDTGDIIITKSVAGMGRKFYGSKDPHGSNKISYLIKSGGRLRGYIFMDISVGYVNCPQNLGINPVPVIGTHSRTGNVILCLSLTDTARYVMNTQPFYDGNIKTVTSKIKISAERYMGRSNESYGYKWSFPE